MDTHKINISTRFLPSTSFVQEGLPYHFDKLSFEFSFREDDFHF